MAADTSLREVGQWETIVLSASNDSILDYIARKVRTTKVTLAAAIAPTITPLRRRAMFMA